MDSKCSVPDCKEENVTLFSAPIDSERLLLWKKQIGAADQPNSSIIFCEKHFEKRFLTFNDSGATILASNAVPTLYLPTYHKEDQTDTLKVTELLQEQSTCHTFIQGANNLVILLNDCQKQAIKASAHGDLYKGLSFRIYLNNPQAYKKFCPNLNLIPVEELKKILIAKVNSYEKDILFQRLLAMKVKTLIENKKECYISVEEINLTPKYYYHIKRDLILGTHTIGKVLKPTLATTAIVLTIHGILDEWKQCICVAYVDGSTEYVEVWQWIRRCIEQIAFNTDFYIRAVVYKGDSKYFNRDIQEDKPYMLNMALEKVYYVCEASSLLKMFYHNLMTYGYYDAQNELASKQAFIEYIQLNKLDEKYETLNINVEHLQPEKISMHRIKEVINYNVAASILFYSDYGILDKNTATTTAKLVMSIIKLINVLNPIVLEATNKTEHNVSVTISYLHIALQMFSSLSLKTNEKVKPRDDFVKNLKITINSILAMHEETKSRNSTLYSPFCQQRYTFNYFQSMLENVLSKQKQMAPTAKIVDLVFKQVLVQNFLQPINKNLKLSLEKIITQMQNVLNTEDPKSYSFSTEMPIVQHKIVRADYRKLKLGKNPHKELANFLLIKAKAVPDHVNCKINSEETERSESCMVIIVKKMEELFKSIMSLETFDLQDEKVLSSLLLPAFEYLDKIHWPCECFPVLFVKTLYLRFRIYHTIRKSNMHLKITSQSDSKQSLVLDL